MLPSTCTDDRTRNEKPFVLAASSYMLLTESVPSEVEHMRFRMYNCLGIAQLFVAGIGFNILLHFEIQKLKSLN